MVEDFVTVFIVKGNEALRLHVQGIIAEYQALSPKDLVLGIHY